MSNGGNLTLAHLDALKKTLLESRESFEGYHAFCGHCRKPFTYKAPPPFPCPHCGGMIDKVIPV